MKYKVSVTEKEAHTIVLALESAAKYEFSISDAYRHKGEFSKMALKQERKYKRLKNKIIEKIWDRK